MGNNALAVYSEKTESGEQVFKRGYDELIKSKRILIVEDNVSTGGSILKIVKAVKGAGGEIVGVCAMVNKNSKINSDTLGVPFESLGEFFIPTYSPENCPLCKAGIPINTKVGHGKKFLESKK